jgi:hypothetical protein
VLIFLVGVMVLPAVMLHYLDLSQGARQGLTLVHYSVQRKHIMCMIFPQSIRQGDT